MENQVYNINADVCSGSIAKNLKSRRLLLMTDMEGVIDDDNKLISEITPMLAKNMIEKEVIKGGMFGDVSIMHPIINNLCDGGDHYITCFDFYSYLDA